MPTVEPGEEIAPPATGAGASAAPEPSDRQIARIVLNKQLTGGSSQVEGGNGGILVVFEPRNARGEMVAEPGDVSIALVDPAQLRSGGAPGPLGFRRQRRLRAVPSFRAVGTRLPVRAALARGGSAEQEFATVRPLRVPRRPQADQPDADQHRPAARGRALADGRSRGRSRFVGCRAASRPQEPLAFAFGADRGVRDSEAPRFSSADVGAERNRHAAEDRARCGRRRG